MNLQFSPDGNIIGVSNIKEEINFYDFKTWKQIKQLKFRNEVNEFAWDRSGNMLLVIDSSGSVSVFNGVTLHSNPLAVLEYHNTICSSIAIDNNNQYFVTGGTDSLIGVWDMQELMIKKTISNNDFKVLALNTSFDGEFIAGIFEDDINKKYYVEIYDVESGATVYSYSTASAKLCLAWHPKKNILACAGEEKNEGSIHLVHPIV